MIMIKVSQEERIKKLNKVDIRKLKEAFIDPRFYNVSQFIEEEHPRTKYAFISPISCGKTWAGKALAVINAVEKGEHTIWLRRYQTTAKSAGLRNEFFNDIIPFVNNATFSVKGTQDGFIAMINNIPFLWAHGLSSVYNYGNDIPLCVSLVVYDEFLPDLSVGEKFLPNEIKLFNFAYKSYARDGTNKDYDHKAKVFYFGNNHINFSPYFSDWGITFKGQDLENDKVKVVTYIPPIVSEKMESQFYKDMGKEYFNAYILNNTFYKDNFTIQKAKNYTPLFNLKMGTMCLCVCRTDNTFYITRRKPNVTTYGISVSEKGILPSLDLIYNNKLFNSFKIYAMFGKVILESEDLINDYSTLLTSGVL